MNTEPMLKTSDVWDTEREELERLDAEVEKLAAQYRLDDLSDIEMWSDAADWIVGYRKKHSRDPQAQRFLRLLMNGEDDIGAMRLLREVTSTRLQEASRDRAQGVVYGGES